MDAEMLYTLNELFRQCFIKGLWYGLPIGFMVGFLSCVLVLVVVRAIRRGRVV